MNLFCMDAPAVIEASELKPAKVSILAYSGGIMTVPTFGPVAIDLRGLDVTDAAAILSDHRNELGGILGQGYGAIQKSQLFVEGQITPVTQSSKQVIALSKNGFKFQASVGVEIIKRKFLQPGERVQINGRTLTAGETGLLIILKGRLKEVTICAMGCDRSTAVSIAAAQGSETMTQIPTSVGASFSASNVEINEPSMLTASASQEENSIRLQERQRLKRIDQLCQEVPGVNVATMNQLRAQAIDGGISEATLATEVMNLLRASRTDAPAIGNAPAAHIGRLHAEPHEVLEAALLTRSGFSGLAEKELGERVMESSRQYAGMSMVDLFRAALQLEGRAIPTANRDDMLRAGFSTFSIPTALGNAMNRVLLKTYLESPATWRAFCKIGSARNFKEHVSIRPSFVGELEEVGADGQIHHGGLKEALFPWKIGTYAKMLSVTRQDMINDDLGFLDEVAPAMSRASLRKVSDLVAATVMAATSSYFHTSLGNASVLPLGVESLGLAIAAMRKQRDAQNNDLDIQPATLWVPSELEAVGKSALESEFTERIATAADVDHVRPTGNPQRNAVKLEVESRLSNSAKFPGASATRWHLFGRPEDVPVIVGFLNGMQAPTTEFFGLSHKDNQLGVSWRVYHDFGCALGDYRAAYESTGVGEE